MKKNRKFHIQTLGCQMNERDSETIAGILSEMGYSVAADRNEADVAVINTCSVREHADKRFFGTLGQLKKIKEARPDFVVCVCGCMMQQKHITDTIKEKYPWVDIIFGTHNIHELPVLLQKAEKEKESRKRSEKNGIMGKGKGLISVWENGEGIVEDLPSLRLYRHKAFVNIIYGCNNFCTYCIVPYTRGRERSRKPEDILNEVKKLAADGVKEITLLGQNVNSYKGLSGPAGVSYGETNEGQKHTDFADLIYMLQETEGIQRIR
ncbi:MAG TPA: radical SAM protein, partial [Bacillota bacterium]|nr:radical SAM protein [Bacillota bacterium]